MSRSWCALHLGHVQYLTSSPLALIGELAASLKRRYQIGSIDGWQRFGKFHSPEFRQTQDPAFPRGPCALKAQAPRATFTLELGILGTPGEVVAKSPVLITQALGEAGCGHGSEPLVPFSTFPLRRPTRNINAGKVKTAVAVCRSTDLERRVPQPPIRAEPPIPQTALRAVRIGANPIASRDSAHPLF